MRTIITLLLTIVLSALSVLGVAKGKSNIPATQTENEYIFIRSLETDKYSLTKTFEDGVSITVDGSFSTGKSPFTYNGKTLNYAFANCSEVSVENLRSPSKISVYFMLYNDAEATISFKKSAYKLTNADNHKICTFNVPSGNVTLTITGSSKIYGIIIN